MRKTIAVLVALVALLAAAPGASADWTVEEEMIALADWSVPTKDRDVFVWYFSLVLRDHDLQGYPVGAAIIGKGRCVRERKKRNGTHFTSVMCIGRGDIMGNPDEVFEMSPAMDSARLELRKNGQSHTVTWTATDEIPFGYLAGEMCDREGEQGEGHGGGIGRDTEAVAHMFGEHLVPRAPWDFSVLARGAMVTECSDFHGYDLSGLTELEPGDTVRLRRTHTI